MADCHFRQFTHFGLSMIGDAESCRFNHRQIVCAIANSDGLRRRDFILFRQFTQRTGFIFRIDDIADDVAGQLTVHDLQFVGEHRVEMQLVAQILGKEGEAAGGDRHLPAERFQLQHQLGQPRHQRQRFTHLQKNIGIGIFQRRYPLTQAGGEIKFAAHRALGHFRDQLAGTGQFGDFINALDLNRRRVHIHNQQARRA